MTKVSIVIINGSLHGNSESSNTALLLRMAEKELLRTNVLVTTINPELVEFGSGGQAKDTIHLLRTSSALASVNAADGLIVGTGTYWGQGSSTLQKFLEEATPSEGTDVWLGKPAGIIVSEHSSGGQTVLSNLLLTLSNFGCLIPPQGGMVYSRIGQALRSCGEERALDVWGLEDIAAICANVVAYAAQRKTVKSKSWLVDRDIRELNKRWVEIETT